jgi:hypothetical protein
LPIIPNGTLYMILEELLDGDLGSLEAKIVDS